MCQKRQPCLSGQDGAEPSYCSHPSNPPRSIQWHKWRRLQVWFETQGVTPILPPLMPPHPPALEAGGTWDACSQNVAWRSLGPASVTYRWGRWTRELPWLQSSGRVPWPSWPQPPSWRFSAGTGSSGDHVPWWTVELEKVNKMFFQLQGFTESLRVVLNSLGCCR